MVPSNIAEEHFFLPSSIIWLLSSEMKEAEQEEVVEDVPTASNVTPRCFWINRPRKEFDDPSSSICNLEIEVSKFQHIYSAFQNSATIKLNQAKPISCQASFKIAEEFFDYMPSPDVILGLHLYFSYSHFTNIWKVVNKRPYKSCWYCQRASNASSSFPRQWPRYWDVQRSGVN